MQWIKFSEQPPAESEEKSFPVKYGDSYGVTKFHSGKFWRQDGRYGYWSPVIVDLEKIQWLDESVQDVPDAKDGDMWHPQYYSGRNAPKEAVHIQEGSVDPFVIPLSEIKYLQREVPAIPADIMEWVEADANDKKYCGGDLPDSYIYEAAAANEAYKEGAIAMYHKLMEEMPATENPLASYWFEKARQCLVDRNDFKAQLSKSRDQLTEVTNDRDVWKQWYDALKKKMDDALDGFSLEDWLKKNNPYTNPVLSSTWAEGATAGAEADAASIAALREYLGMVQAERDEYRAGLSEIAGAKVLPQMIAELKLKKYPKQ